MSKFTILIVDDIKENIYSLRLLIEESFNVNILTAQSAQEAIEILFGTRVDLILTDIQMPDIDGFEFVQYIKEIDATKNIPIIFITGIYDRDEYKNKGYDLGGIEYITKPIDNHLLTSKLKIYIDIFDSLKESKNTLDITQSLLIQNSKMATIGELIGIISHQLKQPLNALTLHCDAVRLAFDSNKLDEDSMSYFTENSKKQINYMNNTINDFLEFFNPNKSKEKFFVYSCIEKTRDILNSKIRLTSTVLNLNIDKNLVALGSPNELLQVIVNIVNNALDAIIERNIKQPVIWIDLKRIEKEILLTIEDNAGGVKDSDFEKILEPYYTTKENGTGVGLYIVKLIIENNFKGKLDLKNGENGLKFTISLENN